MSEAGCCPGQSSCHRTGVETVDGEAKVRSGAREAGVRGGREGVFV